MTTTLRHTTNCRVPQLSWKLQPKRNSFLDFPKRFRIIGPRLCRSFSWVFVHQPAGGVHAIHAQIHQRAASRQLLIQQPALRNTGYVKLAECGVYSVNSTEFTTLNKFLQM